MTKDEIVLAAKCCIVDNCGTCPLIGSDNCITNFMKHILGYIKENEPALSANSTSSEVVSKDTDNIQLDDSTLLDICQEELEAISEIALDDYPNDYLTGYICAVKDDIKRLRGAN